MLPAEDRQATGRPDCSRSASRPMGPGAPTPRDCGETHLRPRGWGPPVKGTQPLPRPRSCSGRAQRSSVESTHLKINQLSRSIPGPRWPQFPLPQQGLGGQKLPVPAGSDDSESSSAGNWRGKCMQMDMQIGMSGDLWVALIPRGGGVTGGRGISMRRPQPGWAH